MSFAERNWFSIAFQSCWHFKLFLWLFFVRNRYFTSNDKLPKIVCFLSSKNGKRSHNDSRVNKFINLTKNKAIKRNDFRSILPIKVEKMERSERIDLWLILPKRGINIFPVSSWPIQSNQMSTNNCVQFFLTCQTGCKLFIFCCRFKEEVCKGKKRKFFCVFFLE